MRIREQRLDIRGILSASRRTLVLDDRSAPDHGNSPSLYAKRTACGDRLVEAEPVGTIDGSRRRRRSPVTIAVGAPE
jgi:hypothetical protein